MYVFPLSYGRLLIVIYHKLISSYELNVKEQNAGVDRGACTSGTSHQVQSSASAAETHNHDSDDDSDNEAYGPVRNRLQNWSDPNHPMRRRNTDSSDNCDTSQDGQLNSSKQSNNAGQILLKTGDSSALVSKVRL